MFGFLNVLWYQQIFYSSQVLGLEEIVKSTALAAESIKVNKAVDTQEKSVVLFDRRYVSFKSYYR